MNGRGVCFSQKHEWLLPQRSGAPRVDHYLLVPDLRNNVIARGVKIKGLFVFFGSSPEN